MAAISEAIAAQALDLLKQHTIDLVVSDHLMPNMSGLEFLKLVRDRCPVRLVVLGDGPDRPALEAGASSAVKVAIILFNLGGPDSLDAVQPFLRNLFGDPAILRLPSLIRRPLASFLARSS